MASKLSLIPSAAIFDERLGLADLRILCALASFADRSGKCWPATTTLARKLRVSVRRVRTCLRTLEACGYVQTTPRPGHRSVYLIIREPSDPGTSASGVGDNPGSSASGPPEAQHPPNGVTNGTTERKHTVASVSDQQFQNFWRTYPSRGRHSNPKKPARAKFDAALKRGVAAADIVRGAQNYAGYVEREGTDHKYVAQAQTWLTQERWTQYQEQEAAGSKPTPLML